MSVNAQNPEPVAADLPPALTLSEAVTILHRLVNTRRDVERARRDAEGESVPLRDPVTREDVKFLYEAVIELLITETINRGFVRFPGGWGGLFLRVLNARGTTKSTPRGEMVAVGPRPAIRYREGLAARTALGKLSPFEQDTLTRRTPRRSKLDPKDF